MRHRLTLNALDGRESLGFLAALGILRILTEETQHEAALSFSDISAQAVLHGPFKRHDELAGAIGDVFDRIPVDGCLPDVSARFPPPRPQTGREPLRVPRETYRQLLATSLANGGPAVHRWLPSIVTDLACDKDRLSEFTPFYSPFGKQSIRTFFENSTKKVRDRREFLLEALVGWQRVDGFNGEYLDHRAWRSAADHPRAENSLTGVPGATWLATMALPLLRLVGDGQTVSATLWRAPPSRPTYMTWPLWRQPLDASAAVALIEHPTLQPIVHDDSLRFERSTWPALGVFAMAAAYRRGVDDKGYARPLHPHRVLHVETSASRSTP